MSLFDHSKPGEAKEIYNMLLPSYKIGFLAFCTPLKFGFFRMPYKLFDEIENNMSVWLVIYLKPGIHSILSHLREGLGIGYFCLNFEHKAYLNESNNS